MPNEAADSPRSEKPLSALSTPIKIPPPANPIRIASTGCSDHWSCSCEMDQLPSTHRIRKNNLSINSVMALNLLPPLDKQADLRPVNPPQYRARDCRENLSHKSPRQHPHAPV